MKKLIEFILSNILWEVIKLFSEPLLKAISDSISYIIWICGFILLNSYLIYCYFIKRKNRYFAFSITGKIFSFFHINNPDHFPILNEGALKKHTLQIIKSKDLPLNALIDKVSLYQGTDEAKYVLVVKLAIDEQHPDFSKFMNHWQPDSLRFLAHKNFGAEVYRSGYSSDSCLLDDWFIWVQPLNEELPDNEIIIEEYNWVLFKENLIAIFKKKLIGKRSSHNNAILVPR